MPIDSWTSIGQQLPSAVFSAVPFSMSFDFLGTFDNVRYINVDEGMTIGLTDVDGNLIKMPSKLNITPNPNYKWTVHMEFDFLQPEVIFNTPVPQYTGQLPINLILVMKWTEQYVWFDAGGHPHWSGEEVQTAFVIYWEPVFNVVECKISIASGLMRYVPHDAPLDMSIYWLRPIPVPIASSAIDHIDFWDVGGAEPVRVWEAPSNTNPLVKSKIHLESIKDVLSEFSDTQSTYYLDVYTRFEHEGRIDGCCPYFSEYLCNLLWKPLHPWGGPKYQRTGQSELIRWKLTLVPPRPIILSYTMPSGRFPADESFSLIFKISNTGFWGNCYLEAICNGKTTRLKTWETEAGAAVIFSGDVTMQDLANNPDGPTDIIFNVGYFKEPDNTGSEKIQTDSMSTSVDIISTPIAQFDIGNSSFPPGSASLSDEITFDLLLRNIGMAGEIWVCFEEDCGNLGSVEHDGAVEWILGPVVMGDLVSTPPAGGDTVSFRITCGHYEEGAMVQDDLITRSIYVLAPIAQLTVTISNVMGEIFLDGESIAFGIVSGYNIEPGSHTLSFGDVEGYITPADITFNVLEGETKIFDLAYTQQEQPPEEEEGGFPLSTKTLIGGALVGVGVVAVAVKARGGK